MRGQGVRGAAAAAVAATPARVPVDENAGVAVAPRSTPRGPLALRPANVMTSPVWKALLPVKPATTPRPRKVVRRSPGSEPRRDVGRVHGGGGGSCHFCRRSSSRKWGLEGVLASEQCGEGKTHAFHLGCLAVSFPDQLASGACPACLELCCGDACPEILCKAGERKTGSKRPRESATAPAPRARAPGDAADPAAPGAAAAQRARTTPPVPRLTVVTRSASEAAPSVSESAVNTPGAGALSSPLMLGQQLGHLVINQDGDMEDDEGCDAFFRSFAAGLGREAPQHTSWQLLPELSVFDDDESVTGFGLLADDPVLQYQPGGMRRGSLPVVTGAPAAAAASPDGGRHTLPLCLFGESFI